MQKVLTIIQHVLGFSIIIAGAISSYRGFGHPDRAIVFMLGGLGFVLSGILTMMYDFNG